VVAAVHFRRFRFRPSNERALTRPRSFYFVFNSWFA